jgi:hypothetical protein
VKRPTLASPSGNFLLLFDQMPLAVLRGLSALMRSDVVCESSECNFRLALRLKSVGREKCNRSQTAPK